MPILRDSFGVVGPASSVVLDLQDDDSLFAVAPKERHTTVTTFGTYGTGNGNLNYPYGATIIPDGSEIWICDGSNHRIARFQLDGTWVGSFGSYGTGDGQFNTPRDIAVDASGNAYVADSFNHRIQKFNSSGVYQSQWSTGVSSYPNTIVFDAQNSYLWVACRGTEVGNIYAYNTSGAQQVTFGILGYSPKSVTIDRRARRVYVGTGTGYIFRYSPGGAFQGVMFAGDLNSTGDIYVDIDEAEILFICEPFVDRIWKGLYTGELLSTFCVSGTSGSMAVQSPISIVKKNEFIYVVDSGNHRVHKLTSGTAGNAFGFKIDYQGNIQHTGYLIHTE